MKKKLLAILGVIALGLAIISFRGGKASYCIFYACLLIPLMSLVYLLRVYVKFKLYQHIDNKTIVKGERVNYTFDISNEDIITYTNIKVRFETDKVTIDEFDTDKVYSLLPGDKVSYHTTLYCKYCGKYDIGIRYATIRDFLGLFSFNYRVDTMISVNVLPRIIQIDKLSIAFDEFDEKSGSNTYGGEMRPDNQLRNYMPGDSARMIHYKASARQNKLFSRQYRSEAKRKVTIVIDNCIRVNDELESIIIKDKITEAALAIVNYYYVNNIQADIVSLENVVKTMNVYDKNTFNEFYARCCKGLSASARSFENMAEALFANGYSDYTVLTHNLTEGAYVKCAAVANTGALVNILYVGNDEVGGLDGVNKNVRVVTAGLNDDIEGVLTG